MDPSTSAEVVVVRCRAPPSILCCVCDKPLSAEEKTILRRKGLCTFKRQINGRRSTYSCCNKCCWELAAIEANHTDGTDLHLEGDGVLLLTGKKSWHDLEAWCRFCLSLLNYQEKTSNTLLHIPFICRRGRWRGVCNVCHSRDLLE